MLNSKAILKGLSMPEPLMSEQVQPQKASNSVLTPELLAKIIIRRDSITQPIPVVSFNGSPALFQGDISLLKAKAKSGKSTLVAHICAAITGEASGIISSQTNKKTCLYIDTEQGKHWLKRFFDVHEQAGGVDDNLIVISLTDVRSEHSESGIIEIISALVDMYRDDLGLLVIDNVSHLCNINDLDQAKNVISSLHKIKGDTHILCVLHENKSAMDSNARGHLGTEMVNNVSCVIQIKRNDKDDNFEVLPAETRSKPFASFSFKYEGNEIVFSGNVAPKKSKSDAISEMVTDDERLTKFIDSVFALSKSMDKDKFQREVKRLSNVGDNHSRVIINSALDLGLISAVKVNKKITSYERI